MSQTGMRRLETDRTEMSKTGKHRAETGRMTIGQTGRHSTEAGRTGKLKIEVRRLGADSSETVSRHTVRIRKRRKVYLILTALILAALAITALFLLRDSAANEHQEYSRHARESYAEGDYENALLYLRRALRTGKDPELLMLMADCYESLENYERAIETLRELNTADSAIASRIQSVEQKRSLKNKAEIVTVAGTEYERDTKTAELDGKGITDEQLKNVAALYALDSLSLRDNLITSVEPLAVLGGLDRLDLSGNQIRSVEALSSRRGLRSLNLSGNPVTDCSVLGTLVNLNTLNLTETSVSEESLQTLANALPACAIRIGDEENEEILFGASRYQADTEELRLSGKGLRTIDALEEFTEVQVLDLSKNEISDLRPLMRLSGLRSLDISENLISDLRPLMGLPSLKKLNASGNQVIDTAAVGACTALEELSLSGNRLGDFSGLAKLSSLSELNLSGTGVKDSVLPELYDLKLLHSLDLQNNSGLSDREIGALKSALPGCTIMTSELVYEVEFAGHTVRSDEKSLAFPGSGITDLNGLERLNRLEELDLSRNEITNLYVFEIASCKNCLKTLRLSGNQITDVLFLGGLAVLEELDLSNNQIQATAGLKQLASLKRLNLTGNPLLDGQLEELREALPNCQIAFSETE